MRVSAVLIAILISKDVSKSHVSSLSYASPKIPDGSGRGLLAAIPYTGSSGVKDTFRLDGVFTDEGKGGRWWW